VSARPTKIHLQKSSKKKKKKRKKENWFDVERFTNMSFFLVFSLYFCLFVFLYSVESLSLYICALPFFFFFFLLKNYHLIYCVCLVLFIMACVRAIHKDNTLVWLVCAKVVNFTMKTGALQKKAAIMCRSISAVAKNRFLSEFFLSH
jgi:hypothetical protein